MFGDSSLKTPPPIFAKNKRIPDNVNKLNVVQLRAIIAARGGKVTSDKDNLIKYASRHTKNWRKDTLILVQQNKGLFLLTISVKSTLNPRDEVKKCLMSSKL